MNHSGRNVIANKQKNCNYRPQPVVVSNRKAVIVEISWTDAPVVKVTARKAFKLFVKAMDVTRELCIQRTFVWVPAGTTIYFVKSATHAGWYYLTILSDNAFTGTSCTCVAGLNHKHCHHLDDVASFEARRVTAVREAETILRRCAILAEQTAYAMYTRPTQPRQQEEW